MAAKQSTPKDSSAGNNNAVKIMTGITDIQNLVTETNTNIQTLQEEFSSLKDQSSVKELVKMVGGNTQLLTNDLLELHVKLDKLLSISNCGVDGKRGAIDPEYTTSIQQIKTIVDDADKSDADKVAEIKSILDTQPKAPAAAPAKKTTTKVAGKTGTQYKTALTWFQAQWKNGNEEVMNLFDEALVNKAKEQSTYKNAKTDVTKTNAICKYIYDQVKENDLGAKIEEMWKA